MYKLSKIIVSSLLSLLLFSSAYSQVGAGHIDVKFDLFLSDGSVLYLSDLGLTGLGSVPLIFAVTIENYYSTDKSIYLKFGISRGEQELFTGTSGSITVPKMVNSTPGRKYLTNQTLLSNDSEYSLKGIDISDATEELKDQVLATGKLPSGVYKFFVEVLDFDSDNSYDIAEEFIQIGAPTILDLISPGTAADQPEVQEIFTSLPFFLWESNAPKFEITVCEKMEMNSDPVDVMRNEPRLQTIVENQTFFQYPADAWELNEGRTYYWQVVALLPSSSGEIRLESEILGFKIGSSSSGSSSIEHQQLLNNLQLILNSQLFDQFFGEGGPLYGFTFTGVVMLNGEPVKIQDLNDLITQIFQGKIKIKGYSVE